MVNGVGKRLGFEKALILSGVDEILNPEYYILSSLNEKFVKSWTKEDYDKLEERVEMNLDNGSQPGPFKRVVDMYKTAFK